MLEKTRKPSLLSTRTLFIPKTFKSQKSRVPSSQEFFQAMAIFFPGTLGMIASLNSINTIKDPEKALPKGTFVAIATSTSTYVALGLLVSSCVANAVLTQNNQVMASLAITKWIVIISLLCSTLSQSFSSFSMAPNLFNVFGFFSFGN